MLQVNIAYDGLLACLNEILNDPRANTFGATLSGSTKEIRFGELFDLLQNSIREIEIAKSNQELYSNYSGLNSLINDFRSEFGTYVFPYCREIRAIISLSNTISNQVLDLTSTVDIDVTSFELINVDGLNQYSIGFYHFVSPVVYSESFFVIDITNLDIMDNYLATNPTIDLKLLFILLSKFDLTSNVIESKYILINSGNQAYPQRIISAVLLHFVSDGKPFHRSQEYIDTPQNLWRNEIKFENKYQQFFDTIYIISEYNDSKDILNKFLKLYHIIEDFMYKYSLVKLEQEKAGEIFSIRDFKRMNEEISDREIEAMLKFIEVFFNQEASVGVLFKDKFYATWRSLPGSFTNGALDIDGILRKFRIRGKTNIYTFTNIELANFHKVASQFIYNFRNSIVHNKTTEFHLTYNNLNHEIFLFMSSFLIKIMEEIVFYLISKSNNPMVWFINPNLRLWENN